MFLLIINSRSEEIYFVSNLVKFISCQPSDQFVLFMPLIKLFNTPGFKLMLANFLLIGHQDSWMRGRGSGLMPDWASPGQERSVQISETNRRRGRLS